MNLVLGVDGGNTKTLALVARSDGGIIGTGRAGCGDIYGATSPDAAIAEIEHAVEAALTEAGVQSSELSAGAFSLAGADWPEDFRLLEDSMRARGYGQNILIVNDAMGALRAGSPDGTGVVVACGTGAAIGARHPDGRVWHSSFWQEPQGAGELSRRTLRAVYRAELGIDPPTILTERILETFGARSVEEVLHWLTARDIPRPENWHQLVRPLFDAANAGDAAAGQIVISHGKALGDYAIAAARQVGLLKAPFTLVLTGGVLRHPSPLLRDALVARVREAASGARAIQSRFEPAVGAVLLALELAHITTDTALLEQLEVSQPSPGFFAT
ncbi:MAG TPA: BadF/BadG/BcrA/BcrD ATPase family protein [Anaerolineales bacterium]|nr:BadF/BadG/BcrA/BcrD ATPase family protein [Anaerolineales bacterium]